ncbi:MAG: hypothetical protein AABX19_04750 [Nanoarchaeota archaeon]
MKRTDFSRESQIVGRDFNELIRKYGGKAAGLHLAEKIFHDSRNFMSDSPIIPRSAAITTSLYDIAESILKNAIPKPLEWYKEKYKNNPSWQVNNDKTAILNSDISDVLYTDENFMKELNKNLKNCRRKFHLYQFDYEYHLRSSSTIEDFVDDRYFGTFTTLQRKEVFNKSKRRGKLPLAADIVELIKWFYTMKHHTNGSFELSDEDSLGMILMESIPGLHVISYSSYPEIPGSPVVHEVSKVSHYEDSAPNPLVFIKVHGNNINDIEVIPATSNAYFILDPKEELHMHSATTKSYHEFENPFDINGVRSPISFEDIRKLSRNARTLENVLGYSANTETILFNNGGSYYTHYLVQLRPVPVVENFSQLKDPDPSLHVLAETPFVYGAFNYRAPVLFTEDKNVAAYTPGISIEKPVIVYGSESRKGHRLFFDNKGDNCVAMINPEQGRTLSHEHSIFPMFGADRNKFHAIGVPQLSDLFTKLIPTNYPLLNGQLPRGFRESPFSLVIESDGRNGRVSVPKEFLELYKNTIYVEPKTYEEF